MYKARCPTCPSRPLSKYPSAKEDKTLTFQTEENRSIYVPSNVTNVPRGAYLIEAHAVYTTRHVNNPIVNAVNLRSLEPRLGVQLPYRHRRWQCRRDHYRYYVQRFYCYIASGDPSGSLRKESRVKRGRRCTERKKLNINLGHDSVYKATGCNEREYPDELIRILIELEVSGWWVQNGSD